MKIGIDIDDTICDTFNNIAPLICKYYNYSLDEFLEMYKKDCNVIEKLPDYLSFAKIYYPTIIPNLPIFKDVREVIFKLKEKYEIVFITARSTLGKDFSYKICSDYLKNNGIYYDKLIVNSTNKYDVCKRENISIFIDNSIKNCLMVSKLPNTKVLLYENKYNEDCPYFKHVKNWIEIYNILK